MLEQLRKFAEQKLEQCANKKDLIDRLSFECECFGAFNFVLIQTHSPEILDLWDEFAPRFYKLLNELM